MQHYSYAGYFDHAAYKPYQPAISRPIDSSAVEKLAAEFGPEIQKNVTVDNGYATCGWAGSRARPKLMHEFLGRLVAALGCEVIDHEGHLYDPLDGGGL